MKPIRKRIERNSKTNEKTIIITVQYSYLFGLIKKNVDYSSTKVIIANYREWVKEPHKLLVPDHNHMSYQLDTWNERLEPEDDDI